MHLKTILKGRETKVNQLDELFSTGITSTLMKLPEYIRKQIHLNHYIKLQTQYCNRYLF